MGINFGRSTLDGKYAAEMNTQNREKLPGQYFVVDKILRGIYLKSRNMLEKEDTIRNIVKSTIIHETIIIGERKYIDVKKNLMRN